MVLVCRVLRLRAAGCGEWPRRSATARTRRPVASVTRRLRLCARETVATETPAARATSLIVTIGARDVIGYMPGRLSRPPGECADPVVRTVARLHLVVADHADRAVGLEHGEPHVVDRPHAVLAQRLEQLVTRDPGARAVGIQHLAAVDQHDALAGQEL